MSGLWILVADASRARIFAADTTLTLLDPVFAVDHPDSRKRTSELVTDGRGQVNAGPSPTRYDARHDAAELEHESFAIELAHQLAADEREGRFEQLVVAAAPRFLGVLRTHFPPPVRAKIVADLHHDYTKMNREELLDVLRLHLVR